MNKNEIDRISKTTFNDVTKSKLFTGLNVTLRDLNLVEDLDC